MYQFWPHYFMKNAARHLYKYKFNYGVKGFAAYVIYRDVANHMYVQKREWLTLDKKYGAYSDMLVHSGIFMGLCLFI